jgi:hypothetical protein
MGFDETTDDEVVGAATRMASRRKGRARTFSGFLCVTAATREHAGEGKGMIRVGAVRVAYVLPCRLALCLYSNSDLGGAGDGD